jgi:MFS transporter, DHA1 family, tetracycline resistance protein
MPPMTLAPTARAPGKNAFLFVVVAVALNMLSFGLIMPIMPALLAELTNQPIEIAIKSNGWLAMVFAVANFLAMPLLGGLSDKYGRRPVLLISIAMLGVDMVILGLAPTLGILFLGRALAGVFSGTVSVANAYVADVTAPEDRGRAFGILGAAFGFGFILGPSSAACSARSTPASPSSSRPPLQASTSSTACSSCPRASPPKTAASSASPAPIHSAP